MVLEHLDSLEVLGALWLINRQSAQLDDNFLSKTLWGITYRTYGFRICWPYTRWSHGQELKKEKECDRTVIMPSLCKTESIPFKVLAWLYRRASLRWFGMSEESLAGCMDVIKYHLYHG